MADLTVINISACDTNVCLMLNNSVSTEFKCSQKQAGWMAFRVNLLRQVWFFELNVCAIYANNTMVPKSRNNSLAVSVFFLSVAYVSRAFVYITEYLRKRKYSP